MSFTRKFAWSGSAVLVATVLSLALMVQSAVAAVTLTTAISGTVALTTNLANGTGVGAAVGSLVLTESAAAQFAVGNTIILNAPSGWRWADGGAFAGTQSLAASGNVGTINTSGSQLTVTISAASAGGAGVGTLSSLEMIPLTNASATGNITLDSTSSVISNSNVNATLSSGAVLGAVTAGTALTGPYTITITPQGSIISADGTNSLAVVAALRDANSAIVTNTPVLFSAGIGCYTSACTTTSTIFTASTGNATASYRGKGTAGTDTIVATVASLTAVGTQTVSLVAPVGTAAASQSVTSVTNNAVAATTTTIGNQYITPTASSDITVRVVDAAGAGVNSQVMLLTVDKGALAGGAGASCTGVTAKSITQTTATISSVLGRVQVTYCPLSTEQGTATLTSQNISTTAVPNVTRQLTSAGKPATITNTVAGSTITSTVKDANGVVVANGTPVRFTVSSTVGVASSTCALTSDGAATSVIALTGATGNVITSTDYAETGAAATCASAGTEVVSSVVNLGGAASAAPAATAGTGKIASGSVPASGGFGLVVFGGTTAQLVTASGCPQATAAFWATSAGEFVTYIPGTGIAAVNAAFLALFPGDNIPANTPLVGKCV
ncbi:MAG: hypothetical protein FJ035_03870 [Chloroflexi bacterium]|nr:hypothetical protein [Chloroflexota bacterium]